MASFSKPTLARAPMARESLQWIIDLLYTPMEGARQRRKYIENEWLLNYRAWQGWPSQSYMIPLPDNSIHYFIPALRRGVERNVKRGTKLLMPNMDWHSTLPMDSAIPDANAEAVHSVMRYVLKKKIPVKRNISSGLRCIQLYNFCAINTSVLIERQEVWPYQKTIDPFNFYIFPDTAATLDEALIIFEDSIIPYQVYASFVSKGKDSTSTGLYESLDVNDLHVPEWPYHLIERLAYRGLSSPSDFVQGTGNIKRLTEYDIQQNKIQSKANLDQQGKAFVSLSKVYFRVGSLWYYTVICNNSDKPCVVRLDEEENRPYYRWTNTRPLPGELYTNSDTDDTRVLQNLFNTAISQAEANRSAFAEPPILMDANIYSRLDSKVLGNRKVWLTDGPPRDGYAQLETQDTFTKGIQAAQIYSSMMDRGSGGQLAEGQPGRNMPRAGFASNTLLNMSLIEIEDEADTFEQEILTPGLADIYHVILEYVPTSQIFKIPNKNPQLVKAYSKDDLYGDYSFDWLGALGFQDAQVRADKFLQFLQTIANPQVYPIIVQALTQQGLMLDIAEVLRTIYSFGLSERGLGDIIKAIPPQLQQQQAQAQAVQAQLQMQQTQSRLQHDQARVQGEALKNQGKVLDLKGKVLDLQGKRVEMMHHLLKPIKGTEEELG